MGNGKRQIPAGHRTRTAMKAYRDVNLTNKLRKLIRGARARLLVVAGVISVLAAFVVLQLRSNQPPQIAQDAREIAFAMARSDGGAYFDHIHEFQVEKYGLSRDKVKLMFDRLVGPRLSGLGIVGASEWLANEDLSEGRSAIVMKDDAGHELSVSATAIASDKGGTTSLTHVLVHAWCAEYLVKRGIPVTATTSDYARYRGVSADMEFLTSIGIEGKIDDQGKFRSWSEYRDGARGRLLEKSSELAAWGLEVPR